jgi:hypothetical protein
MAEKLFFERIAAIDQQEQVVENIDPIDEPGDRRLLAFTQTALMVGGQDLRRDTLLCMNTPQRDSGLTQGRCDCNATRQRAARFDTFCKTGFQLIAEVRDIPGGDAPVARDSIGSPSSRSAIAFCSGVRDGHFTAVTARRRGSRLVFFVTLCCLRRQARRSPSFGVGRRPVERNICLARARWKHPARFGRIQSFLL